MTRDLLITDFENLMRTSRQKFISKDSKSPKTQFSKAQGISHAHVRGREVTEDRSDRRRQTRTGSEEHHGRLLERLWQRNSFSLISSSPSSSFSHSSSTSSSSCCPSTSLRLSCKIPCAASPSRWGQLTNPTSSQVMSPTPTTSRRLTSSPTQSP